MSDAARYRGPLAAIMSTRVLASADHHQEREHPGRMTDEHILADALQVAGLCLPEYTREGTARRLLYLCDALEAARRGD